MDSKIILLSLFIAVSVLHLVSLFYKKSLIQVISKCLLMPTLLAFYIVNTHNINPLIGAALILGCAGDILLININNIMRFRIGLVSFLLGHIAYIIVFINTSWTFNYFALGVSIAIAIILGIILYKMVHPNMEMKIPVIVYEIVIFVMVILAYQVLLKRGSPYGALVFAGGLCFLASDSMLARFTFVKQIKFGQHLVMLTYIAAQFLITLGFCRL